VVDRDRGLAAGLRRGPRPPLDTNQARKFAPAVDRWLTAIREGTHHHDGDELTAEHVKAAHLQKVRLADEEDDGRTKYVLVKGDDRAASTAPSPTSSPTKRQ
jgi:hypothetical protein